MKPSNNKPLVVNTNKVNIMTSNFAFRYVSLTPEHTTSTGARSYGTASGGGSATFIGEVDDESIQHRFDLLTRADMSRYGAAKSLNGKEHSEGGINLVLQPDDFCGLLFYGVYGDKSTANSSAYTFTAGSGGTDPDVHTWTEAADHLLPSFTMEVGREVKEHTYTGMCLTRLSLSAAVGEYVSISADFVGKAESASSTLNASPTFVGGSVDGMHFKDATVTFSTAGSTTTAATNIKSVSLEWSMNLDTDSACSLGSNTYVRQPAMQMREITGTIEFSNDEVVATEIPDYFDVTASGGLLYDGGSAPAIRLSFQGASADDLLEIQIHKVRWEAPTNNVSGRDHSSLSLGFVALVDTGSSDKMSTTKLKIDNQGSAGRYSTL